MVKDLEFMDQEPYLPEPLRGRGISLDQYCRYEASLKGPLEGSRKGEGRIPERETGLSKKQYLVLINHFIDDGTIRLLESLWGIDTAWDDFETNFPLPPNYGPPLTVFNGP